MLQFLRRETIKNNRIGDLLNSEEFFKFISTTVERSPAELLLIALKLSLTHNLTFTALSQLLQYVNRICCKQVLPDTRYTIDKLFNSGNITITLHGVCVICQQYLGTFDSLNNYTACDNYGIDVEIDNPSDPCFFAIIDPSEGVRNYLQTYEKHYNYVVRERLHKKNCIKDIYDGKLYRTFVKNLPESDRYTYATAIFNTDGASVFKCSKYSIWPIYLMLNEIPVEARFRNLIVTGLWFGRDKPDMSIFLKMFTDSMNILSTEGIICLINGEQQCIKLYALVSCVDTIARAPMNGTIQFNGHFGCDWCEHRGEYFGGSMRYPFRLPRPVDRDAKSTIAYAEQAIENSATVYGVKSASPLLYLRGFDIISSFVSDYMHCLLAGVAEQFTEYILNSLKSEEIQNLEYLISRIKAPHQVIRLTRSLKDRKDWKAREWENWVLYYSIPLLTPVVKNKKIMHHWSLFVRALHICLKADITYAELNVANELFNQFVFEAETLYSMTAMTYNVHQMLHIAKSVYDWGPLWAHSAFAFETANRDVLSAIKSAKGVILQIVRHINLKQIENVLEEAVYPQSSAIVKRFCQTIDSTKFQRVTKTSNVTYLGRSRDIDLSLLREFNISDNYKVYSRMVMKGCLFGSSTKINKRSCNYFAQLRNKQFIKMKYFILDITRKSEITLCQAIKTKLNQYSTEINEVLQISNQISAVSTLDIENISVYIETENKKL